MIVKGISFPLEITSRGGFKRSLGVEKIKENVKNLVLTSLGERVMNPGIGTLGYMYLFRNMSYEERQLLQNQVAQGIERGEERVFVLSVDIDSVNDQGTLNIMVQFRIDQYEDNYDVSVIVEV